MHDPGREDRVCVGGPGYIKFLLDTDGDGKADRAELFTDEVRTGVMGLLIEGKEIISVERNAVLRYRDEDGDFRSDGVPQVLAHISGKGGEHGPHGIRRGPDGWLYVVCGNNSGVDESHATLPESPIKHPSQGAIVRIAPDGSGSEVVAHGFRNPYDIAFSDEGRLFTFDSDNERDHHLPWHANTRVFDVAFGRHHGWLNPGHKQSYNTPAYYAVDRFAEVPRGSPTGVEYYWHDAFPERYRKGLFHACWTFGRIYYSPLQWKDELKLGQELQFQPQVPEVFARVKAEGGFAPVDLAIDSYGSLWVACGGRNTKGNVYRISAISGDGTRQPRKLTSLPKAMVGRILPESPLQHPYTVRTFLKDPKDLHLVYHAYQQLGGGITHRPEPRVIDAGYRFRLLPDPKAEELRATIRAEAGDDLFEEMNLQAEHALTEDAANFAEYWLQAKPASGLEPWRRRNYLELARTLGCARTEFAPVLEHITTALRDDTHPTDDIHYLFCLAQMPAPRTSIANWRIASAFLQVDAKLAAIPDAHPSRNWSLRLQDVFRVHCELSPLLENDVMWSHSLFGNSVHHARYVETITDPEIRKRAVRLMYQRLQTSGENWNASWTRLVKENMPDLPIEELRSIWDTQPEIRNELASWILERGDPQEDRTRFFQCLGGQDASIAARAAARIGNPKTISQAQAELAMTALVRHQKKDSVREALAGLFGAESLEDALEQARKEHPESAIITRLCGSQDHGAFLERLKEIDWGSGRQAEGKEAFARLGCAACHGGNNRLGPTMRGVSARFGKEDFFRHTIQPNLAISDLYRASELRTRDGQTFVGIPVYSSPDQTLLELSNGQVVNLSDNEIVSRGRVQFSPMPEGLLLGASNRDLADLWAYVREL